jgi:hypothetical protein
MQNDATRSLVDALPLGKRCSFIRADTKRAVYVSLNGERAPSWPALREAERKGYLSDAIYCRVQRHASEASHLRRLNVEAVSIIQGF